MQSTFQHLAFRCSAFAFTLLTGAFLTLTGCDSGLSGPDLTGVNVSSTAATNGVYNNNRFPFSFTTNVCGEEDVAFQGTFHILEAETVTSGEHVLLRFHINAKGTGTGLTSGATYQWHETINDAVTFDGNDGAPFTPTFTQTLTVIGQGQAPNFRLKTIIQLTVNANGDITSMKSDFQEVCE